MAYATLEEFIAAQAAHITPHRPWYNHWSNAFGFHDEEFVEPKPAGRLRILVVGDSFTFAPVPYPQGVMTLTEAALRAACGGRDLDVLNMGLMGAGPPEYRILAELGVPRFAPDLVLVNLFLGNDPPDLHRYVHDRSPLERALRRSHAWTFAKNLLRARGGLREARLPGAGGRGPAGSAGRRAGAPAWRGPASSPRTTRPWWGRSSRSRPTSRCSPRTSAASTGRETSRPSAAAWQPFLADLDAMHGVATRAGSRMALALMPSVLQVDPALRAATVARLSASVAVPGTVRRRDRSRASQHAPPGVRAGPRHSPRRPHAGIRRRERRQPEPLYKRSDNHWTPRGNRVAARLLTAFLAPLACAPR